jgi:predicted dehydrogenase
MARMAHGPDRRGPGTHLPRRGAFAGATRDGGSRRSFLRESLGGSLAAGAAAFAAPAILRAENRGDKLRIAVIGCGGRGAANLAGVAGEQVVALCDVNAAALGSAAAKAPAARHFADFRKLYDDLQPSAYDAVVVSTTEHTHAFATLPALAAKKHVYCEKPLAHNVRETRLVTQAAARAGVATQMGTQIHASDTYRRVVELVKAGAIGPIKEVHVWVGRAWGLQSPEDAAQFKDIVTVQERPAGASPVPPQLDWNLWLGPAPERPFHEVYFPGPKWYRWWDFGGGTMSDLGSHWLDLPFWALDLDAPQTVEAFGPPPHAELAPASMHVTYDYAARGDRGPVTLSWYQGSHKPKAWTDGQIPRWDSGCLFVGGQGQLLADYGRHLLLLGPDVRDFHRPATSIPQSPGHYAEWIQACKTGSPTTCPFSYSGPLTEANQLGNVAHRAGRKIAWDAAALRIPNAPEAERFLGREYRPGWALAGIA